MAGSRRLAGMAAAVLIAGLLPSVSAAQAETPAPEVEEVVDAQDKAAVDAAQDAFAKGGYDALKDHLDAVQLVIAHARRPKTGSGQVLCRALNLEDFLKCAGWARARGQAGGQTVNQVIWQSNTYRWASLLAGSYYNEARLPDQAVSALDKGLAVSPLDPVLTTEKGIALVQLKRFDEAMALYRAALSEDNFLTDSDRARLLRSEGFSLIELGKLDEAEQAYRDSLKIEPDHKGAQGELEYIAQLRAGGARRGIAFPNAEQSKQGESGQ